MPKFMYRKGFSAVHVVEGDPWHGLHPSHIMKRCDFTAFCTRCGSSSSGNCIDVLRIPCDQRMRETKYHRHTLRHLNKGVCPYRKKWISGLDKATIWPPCKLIIFEDGIHHTKCDCSSCRPPPADLVPSDDSGDSGDDSEGEPLRPTLCYGSATPPVQSDESAPSRTFIKQQFPAHSNRLIA